MYLSVGIFNHFPDARKWSGHFHLCFFAFCVEFQKQLAVFLSSCVKDWQWFPVESWKISIHFVWVHRVEKVKITSSIKSRFLSLHVCMTACRGCELYVYMCFHTCRCMHITHCGIFIHSLYMNAQILDCFRTKCTTLGDCNLFGIKKWPVMSWSFVVFPPYLHILFINVEINSWYVLICYYM